MWPLIFLCIAMFFFCCFLCVCFFFIIIRDISPKNGSEVFFSHEIYEKYSLAPSISELWHLSNRYILLPYNILLFVIMLLTPYLTVLGKAACYLVCKHLLLTQFSSWSVLYLLWNLRRQEESRLGPLVLPVF